MALGVVVAGWIAAGWIAAALAGALWRERGPD